MIRMTVVIFFAFLAGAQAQALFGRSGGDEEFRVVALIVDALICAMYAASLHPTIKRGEQQ